MIRFALRRLSTFPIILLLANFIGLLLRFTSSQLSLRAIPTPVANLSCPRYSLNMSVIFHASLNWISGKRSMANLSSLRLRG